MSDTMSKAEKTRQFIIEKAAALFNQKGFHGTSMSDIMKATGLTKGGIYGNFKKGNKDKKGVKEEIAKVAFEHAVMVVNKEISRRTHIIDSPLDKLKTVVYFYKERIFNPPVEGGCPILNSSIESDDNIPALKKLVLKEITIWHERIVHTLEKGIKKGEIKPDINTDEFATWFIGTLEGGILLSRIHKTPDSFNVMAKALLKGIEELKI